MNILTLDVETSTSNKGNPFDQTNSLVCVGLKWLDQENSWIQWNGWEGMQSEIDAADVLVGYNIKFDLHWLRRVGINFSGKKIWDCQIAEFLLENQTNPYPSLNQAAVKYVFPAKLDVVKEEYWSKGIDTDAIPRDILSAYLAQDLTLTEQVYLKQQREFLKDSKLYSLFRLQCQDLLVLEEMEWNGLVFNTEKARQKAATITEELGEIHKVIMESVGNIPINLNSNDHLSCLLFGGVISIDDRIPIGVFKTGEKVGQVRYKKITKGYDLPRLVEPLKGTEVKKPEGGQDIWKTNDDVLKKVKLSKEAKKLVGLINRYTTLEKLCGTYLLGWSNLIDKMNWKHNMIHGNLNQCTVITGRLSSTKP